MSNEWFDKNLENRFNEIPADLNLDAAWNRLEHSRKKKNRKGLIFFFTGLGSTTLIGLALVFWTMSDRLPQNLERTSLPETKLIDILEGFQNCAISISIPSIEEIAQKEYIPIVTATNEINKTNITAVQSKPTLPQLPDELRPVTYMPQEGLTSGVQTHTHETLIESKKIAAVPRLPQISFPVYYSNSPKGFSTGSKTQASEYLSIPTSDQHFSAESAAGRQVSPKGVSVLTLSSLYGPSKFSDEQSNSESIDRVGAGLYYQSDIKETFFWRSGIEYNRIANQSTSYSETITMEDQDHVLLEIRLLQDGTMEEIYGQGQVMVLETESSKLWTFDESLSVPVQIGWHFINREKIQFDLYAGTAIGYSLDANKLRWDAHAGLDFNYRIGRRYSLMIGGTVGNDFQKTLAYRWIQGRLGMKMNLFH